MGRLIEQVAVRAQVTADLQGVIAPHLCRRRRYRPGALLAIPRQRRFEADQVVVVAADIDRRDAAGEVVQVHAPDAELVGGLQPIVLANRFVVVMSATEANFLNHRRRPHAVVRPADALRRIGARSGKRLEAAEDPEGCRVERAGVLTRYSAPRRGRLPRADR